MGLNRQTMFERQNYDILGKFLRQFRNIFLAFIIGNLKSHYGKGWWEAGVARVLGKDVATYLEDVYRTRFAKPLSSINRPSDDIGETLDINRFLPIIQGNWDGVFSKIFRQRETIEVWLREVNDARNAVAHNVTKDISTSDTWRALDTILRITRLIDPSRAEEFASVLTQEGVWIGNNSANLPNVPENLGILQGSISQLLTKIKQKRGNTSDEYLEVLRHWAELLEVVFIKGNSPAAMDQINILSILNHLNLISLEYDDTSFLRRVYSNNKPDDNATTLARGELNRELTTLRKDLKRKLVQELAQARSGEAIVERLGREKRELQRIINNVENELSWLDGLSDPPAFFSIVRNISPVHPENRYFEDQLIHINLTIENKGRKSRTVNYSENIPQGINIRQGSTAFKGEIGAGENAHLSYSLSGNAPGAYTIKTHKITYSGKQPQRDNLPIELLNVVPGVKPNVIVSRFYEIFPNRVVIHIMLENKGTLIAYDVKYSESIETGHGTKDNLSWSGEITGEAPIVFIKEIMDKDADDIVFPTNVVVTYRDRYGNPYQTTLDKSINRLEYKFPTSLESYFNIVGRDSEIAIIEETIGIAWRVWNHEVEITSKNLILIEGIEGAGKTRLSQKAKEISVNHGFNCVWVDAKNRASLRNVLNQLMGLDPFEDNEELILDNVTKYFDETDIRNQLIFRFLAPTFSNFTSDEIEILEKLLIALIKKLCESHPTTLIFENLHWLETGGIEEIILLKLLGNVALPDSGGLVIFATYRPKESEEGSLVERIGISRDSFHLIKLNPIGNSEFLNLVDEIIPYPTINSQLKGNILDWARGNPFYLIELLRLLTGSKSTYLVQVNDEWYLNPGQDFKSVIPSSVEEVIQLRINEELKDDAGIAETLAGVGIELPTRLIKVLCLRRFPNLQEKLLFQKLNNLVKAGIIIEKGENYEFEHHLKREVILKSVHEHERVELRKQIAEILLAEPFYDIEEQIRQIARHLIKSPREYQELNFKRIIDAARLEIDKRNFERGHLYLNRGLELIQDGNLTYINLLLERSELYLSQGNLINSENDLENAHSSIVQNRRKLNINTSTIVARIEKARAKLLLLRSVGDENLDRANEYLWRARVSLEGFAGIRRLFPPKRYAFYVELLDIYLTLAEVWLRKRNFLVSREVCSLAEKLALRGLRIWPDKPMFANVYITLGNIASSTGNTEDLERSLGWYSKALSYSVNDNYLKERVLIKMAETNFNMGNKLESVAEYQEAIKLQETLGDQFGMALSFNGLGNIEYENGNYDLAEHYFEKAAFYQEIIGDHDRLWRICLQLAILKEKKGKLTEALRFWNIARTIVIQGRRFAELTFSKQREVINFINVLSHKAKGKPGQLEHFINLQKDLVRLARDLKFDKVFEEDEIVQLHITLGESYAQLRDWPAAINSFKQVMVRAGNPSSHAEANEMLGDIYELHSPPQLQDTTSDEWRDKYLLEAHRHYLDAVTLFGQAGRYNKSIEVYEKLLASILKDKSHLDYLPLIFLDVLRTISSRIGLLKDITIKTKKTLLEHNLRLEAADSLIYSARILSRSSQTQDQHGIVLHFLSEADALYRGGRTEDIEWGIQMQIPSFYRLKEWGKLVHCIEELVHIYVEIKNTTAFIQTLSWCSLLKEKFPQEDLIRIINFSHSAREHLGINPDEQSRYYLAIAKAYSSLYQNSDSNMMFLRMSFENYDKSEISSSLGQQGVIHNDRSVLFMTVGMIKEALSEIIEAVRIAEDQNDLRSAAQSKHNRAKAYDRTGERELASLDYSESIGILHAIVNQWKKREDSPEAELNPSDVVHSYFDKQWLASSSFAYSLFLFNSRNSSDFKKAYAFALEAKKIAIEIDLQDLLIHINQVLDTYDGYLTLNPGLALELQLAPVSSNEPGERTCPGCGSKLSKTDDICLKCGSEFCPNCFALITKEDIVCPTCGHEFALECGSCGHEISAKDQVCANCGNNLTLGF